MARILITDPIGESGITFLTEKGYDVVRSPTISAEELLEVVGDVDAIIVRGRTKVTKAVIDRATNLKVIARSGTGVDTIDVGYATQKGIPVVNAPGANAESVAEHTFGLLLCLTRNIPNTVASMRDGGWSKDAFTGVELAGKTLGIVGFGRIGMRVAQLGAAFGMRILVYNRSQDDKEKKATLVKTGGTFMAIDTLLSESDVVSVHMALTEETRRFIDSEKLRHVKPTAYVLNTSRGGVIDESALIEVLQKGAIRGAGLDVFATEPLAKDSPLRSLENVVLTPHVAADSAEAENRASMMVAQQVDSLLHS